MGTQPKTSIEHILQALLINNKHSNLNFTTSVGQL